jgi:hypothetical protein
MRPTKVFTSYLGEQIASLTAYAGKGSFCVLRARAALRNLRLQGEPTANTA